MARLPNKVPPRLPLFDRLLQGDSIETDRSADRAMQELHESVRRDLETLLQRWAPDGDPAYRHDLEGDDDMAAHARSLLTGTSLTVPFAGGRLLLGTWQGIYLFEHRTQGHRREIVVTLLA